MSVRNVLSLSFITQFCIVLVCAQYRFDCDENFCSKRTCPETKCESGSRLIKNATECGCCHLCIEQLKEGDKCKTQEFAVIPREECGPGLMCNSDESSKTYKTCVPANTNCIRDQIQFDKEMTKPIGSLKIIKSRPECDEFGHYKSIVCISDILCYCVDKEGKRIFGTDVYNKKNAMNCRCSRDYEEFIKFRQVPEGDFLRCLPNGNYDPLQCSEKWCYCMGDSFHILGTKVKANKSIKDLLCYDNERHKNDDANLRSKCWHKRNSLMDEIKKFEKEGVTVVGVDLPLCDLDGSHAPVQCRKDNCYCVKRNGGFYDGSKYKVKRNSDEAKRMTCRCAREKEILNAYKNEGKIRNFMEQNPCDVNGNYKENID